MTRLRISAATHRGRVRAHNEDALGWGGWSLRGPAPTPLTIDLDITSPLTVVVCDGMGGHAGGEVASQIAAEMITGDSIDGATSTADVREHLRRLLQQVSDSINDLAERRPDLRGMGCTVAGLTVLEDLSAVVFNIGDSRVYRIEDRYLAQLSVDHRGSANTLHQALGGGRRTVLEPEFFDCTLPPSPGIILCTDGLDDYVEPLEVEAVLLAQETNIETRLRDLALCAGGGDNVTIVNITAHTPATTDRPVQPERATRLEGQHG